MRRALHSTANGSDKFWRVATLGAQSAVYWGKSGTIGRVKITEYSDEDACLKAANALADAKLKRGYEELDEAAATAAFEEHIYLDDQEEWGPHPLTSHPRFTAHFTGDVWFDPSDEEAPFGSDEGSDAMSSVRDAVRARGRAVTVGDLPRLIVEKEWDMEYVPPALITPAEADAAVAAESRFAGLPQSQILSQSDQVTIAVAVAQAKIFGTMQPDLRDAALLAITRLNELIAAEFRPNGRAPVTSEVAAEVRRGISTFQN